MLLDPVIITRQELLTSDFAENSFLRIVTVEAVEGLGHINSEAATQIELRCLTDGFTNSHPDSLSSSTTKGLTCGLTNGLMNGHAKVSTNDSVNKFISGHTSKHTNGAMRSLKGLAVLMLTSGSSGNAESGCLTHKQILAAVRGELSSMPLPQGSALLNRIALDHVAGLVEHICVPLLRDLIKSMCQL